VLSAEDSKKLLPSGSYTAQEIEEIKDSLYQLANILVKSYLKEKYIKQKGEK
jgi:hypothetical protein